MRRRIAKNQPEWASCSETITLQPDPQMPPVFNTNTMYQVGNVALNGFKRASSIAQGYAQFRMTRITLRFRPLADTFPASASGGQIPYLYYQLDKSRSIPSNANLATLQAMGAVPRRLDDKTLKVSWAPTVLQSAQVDPAGTVNVLNFVKPQIHPWIATTAQPGTPIWTASTTGHDGIYFIASQQGLTTTVQYEVELTAEFQFKNPVFTAPQSDPAVKVPVNSA